MPVYRNIEDAIAERNDVSDTKQSRQLTAARAMLAALANITECAEAGPDGANMDLWIEQARAAIAAAKAAGISGDNP